MPLMLRMALVGALLIAPACAALRPAAPEAPPPAETGAASERRVRVAATLVSADTAGMPRYALRMRVDRILGGDAAGLTPGDTLTVRPNYTHPEGARTDYAAPDNRRMLALARQAPGARIAASLYARPTAWLVMDWEIL